MEMGNNIGDTIPLFVADFLFNKHYISPNTYFFTFTLSTGLRGIGAREQLAASRRGLINLVEEHCKFGALAVELTFDCTIHYHAILMMKGNKTARRRRWSICNGVKKQKELGFFKITPKPIDNEDSMKRALEYLVKDRKDTSKFIGEDSIIWFRQ